MSGSVTTTASREPSRTCISGRSAKPRAPPSRSVAGPRTGPCPRRCSPMRSLRASMRVISTRTSTAWPIRAAKSGASSTSRCGLRTSPASRKLRPIPLREPGPACCR
jgi:hypothetical protein